MARPSAVPAMMRRLSPENATEEAQLSVSRKPRTAPWIGTLETATPSDVAIATRCPSVARAALRAVPTPTTRVCRNSIDASLGIEEGGAVLDETRPERKERNDIVTTQYSAPAYIAPVYSRLDTSVWRSLIRSQS